MRVYSPVSRGSFAVRFSWFDVIWALLTPVLALWLRDAPAFQNADWSPALFYCAISFTFALIAFLAFRTRDGMTHLFSVGDALEVGKAVVVSELMTGMVLFSAVRLDGIPRTTPVIHALLLGAGLVLARAVKRMSHPEAERPPDREASAAEHIMVVGSNRLSALYINFLRAYAPRQYQVVAALDDRSEMIGRSLSGVRVLGPIGHMLPIMEELSEHGIQTHRILIGGDRSLLTPEARAEVERICVDKKVRLDYVSELLGLETIVPQQVETKRPAPKPETAPVPAFAPSRYLQGKRLFDFAAAGVLLLALMPVFAVVTAFVLIDVGSPVFFWQRRIGRLGQSFHIYKFRTLKPSYDWQGRPLPDSKRISSIGSLLRKLRLDELPQLLNVLVGDMSLIGPRPLLPRDQPLDPAVRLSVRPGITGWAQVHGGTLLSPDDKNMLDEWYVRHASVGLDVSIVAKTIGIVLFGEERTLPPAMARKPNGDSVPLDGHAPVPRT